LKDKGTVSLARWPYDPRRCDPKIGSAEDYSLAAQWRIPDFKAFPANAVKALRPYQEALQAGHPVIVATRLNAAEWSKWKGSKTFVYNKQTSPEPSDYHAMVVVGYDDNRKAFRLMNSWGSAWGDNGFMWIDYASFLELNEEAYVIEGLAPAKKPLDALKPPEPVLPPDLRPALQTLITQQRSLAVTIETLPDPKGDRYRLLGRGCSDAAHWLRQQIAGYADRVTAVIDEQSWPLCEADIGIERGKPKSRIDVRVVNLASDAPAQLKARAVRGAEISLEQILIDNPTPLPLPPPTNTTLLREGDRFMVMADIPADTPHVQVLYVQADRSAKSLWSGNIKDVITAPQPVRGVKIERGGTAQTPAWRLSLGAVGSGLVYNARPPFGAEAIIVLAGADPVLTQEPEFNASDARLLDSFDQTMRSLANAGRTWRAGIAATDVRAKKAANDGYLFTELESPRTSISMLYTRQPASYSSAERGGPNLKLIAPSKPIKAGDTLQFEALFERGTSAVDPASLRIEVETAYGWRDLSDRFRALANVTAQKASATQMRLPVGEHTLRVSVQDRVGREALSHVRVTVVQ
jgi:hypothetical protein